MLLQKLVEAFQLISLRSWLLRLNYFHGLAFWLFISSFWLANTFLSHLPLISVQEALRSRGLKDDTTCLVVDIIPSVHPVLPPIQQKKHHGLGGLLFGKKSRILASKSSKLSAVGAVEELFEEGSAILAERFILRTCLPILPKCSFSQAFNVLTILILLKTKYASTCFQYAFLLISSFCVS